MPFQLAPATLLARLIVLVVAMPVHEWAHAWSAYQLGDDTASLRGRLSLNPLAHLDPLGSLLILLTGFGWAQPVPVNPYRMRVASRPGMALSALAGPASNFLVAMVCAIPFRVGWLNYWEIGSSAFSLASVLGMVARVSLGLAVFNMVPLYPLDGEKVLVGLLPHNAGNRLLALRPYSPYILMALIAVGGIGLVLGLLLRPLELLLFLL